jgi:hypothetical protein
MTRSHRSGFTLLETLVMLIISSLAVMMMFQALAGFNRSRERIGAIEGVRNNDVVVLGWVRDSFRGVVAIDTPGATPKPDDPAAGLHGTADGFTALTVAPLLGPAGVPVKVQWSVEHGANGSHLIYQEEGQPPLTLPLRNASDLHFSYLDQEGKAMTNWPPKLGLQAPLPTAIELQFGSAEQARVVVQSITAPLPMQLPAYAPETDE